mmetsp:Transcript_67005/g.218124  ORF Transcript_67005/g.218124 Transcript_67005/m.218124 type:complete len:397 (-) Transcript_67005:69-1259(-)
MRHGRAVLGVSSSASTGVPPAASSIGGLCGDPARRGGAASERKATKRSRRAGASAERSGSSAGTTEEFGAPFKKATSCRRSLRRSGPTSGTSTNPSSSLAPSSECKEVEKDKGILPSPLGPLPLPPPPPLRRPPPPPRELPLRPLPRPPPESAEDKGGSTGEAGAAEPKGEGARQVRKRGTRGGGGSPSGSQVDVAVADDVGIVGVGGCVRGGPRPSEGVLRSASSNNGSRAAAPAAPPATHASPPPPPPRLLLDTVKVTCRGGWPAPSSCASRGGGTPLKRPPNGGWSCETTGCGGCDKWLACPCMPLSIKAAARRCARGSTDSSPDRDGDIMSKPVPAPSSSEVEAEMEPASKLDDEATRPKASSKRCVERRCRASWSVDGVATGAGKARANDR